MRKNITKLMMAGSVAAILFGCTSKSDMTTTQVATVESTMTESTMANDMKAVDEMSETKSVNMSEDMNESLLPTANLENGIVKQIDNEFVRIERIDDQMSNEEADEQAKEVDLIMNPRGFYHIDMVSGSASTDLKAGDEIFAWVAPEYAASLPPQVSTYVILTNTRDKNANVPMYTDEIEKVEETDDKIVLKDTANNAEWTFDKSVKPRLASTDEEADFSVIEKGDKCLIWSETFMLSKESEKPVSIKATKIVVLK